MDSSDEEIAQSRDEALSKVNSHMNKACEILKKEASRVRQEKQALDSVAKKLEHVHFAKTIKLNVGGQHFVTSRETLTKDAGSMLNAMFSGRFDTKPDEDGAYFIDRDGTHFRYILNYLRSGKLVVPDDDTTKTELLIEAEFYQIQGIIDKLQAPEMFTKSTILSLEQREILESWMKGQSKFTLLFCASRDGWSASNFHSCCDKKGPTVTVVKSGNYIFGGFADVSWDSLHNSYKTSEKSFLFSLVNPAGTGPTKMALKAAKKENGILCDSSYGPTFGRGHDLHIADEANANTNSYSYLNSAYECPTDQIRNNFLTGNQNFSVNEYEVFGYQEG